MDKKRLEECKQRLYSQTPLIGGWQRRKAAGELAQAAREPSVDLVTTLVEAVTRSSDLQVRATLVEALKQIKDQNCIDTACAAWASSRHAELNQLMSSCGWVASGPAPVRVLSALKAGKSELVAKGGTEMFEPLMQACKDADADIARQAREGLSKLQNAELIDALCARWAKEREETLAQILVQKGYIARQPINIQVLSALKVGKPDVLVKGSVAVVEPLLQACSDLDPEIARQARTALRQLKNADAQEALCKLAIDRDDANAREAAAAANFAPRDPQQKLIFYFLTEQWDKYEAIDADQKQLRAIYQSAAEPLRQRLSEKANLNNYALAEPVYTERRALRIGEISDKDWEDLLLAVEKSKQRADVLRLVQEAPPRRGLDILKIMKKSNWVPRGEEKTGYEELIKLVEACDPIAGSAQGASYRTLEGHSDVINCLVISPDGRVLVSGGSDQTIHYWSLPDGKNLQKLAGHTGAINTLAITPNGKVLISGSADNSVRLWSLPDAKPLATLTGHSDEINCLAVSPDGKYLASGSLDNTVRLWSLPEGKELKELKEHSGSIWSLLFSPGGNLLASGGGLSDHKVRLWSVPDGADKGVLEGHKGLVRCLAFTNDGKTLVSGSGDNTIRIWDVAAAKELKVLKNHRGLVNSLVLLPDGQTLASGSVDKSVRLWRLSDGQELKKFDKYKDRVTALVADSSGRVLVSSSWDNSIRLTTVAGRRELKILQGHTNWVTCLAVSPDNQVLASGSRESAIRLWQLKPSLLSHLPTRQISPDELAWAEKASKDGNLSKPEQQEMAFVAALMRWRQRLNNKNSSNQLEIAQFDIDIS